MGVFQAGKYPQDLLGDPCRSMARQAGVAPQMGSGPCGLVWTVRPQKGPHTHADSLSTYTFAAKRATNPLCITSTHDFADAVVAPTHHVHDGKGEVQGGRALRAQHLRQDTQWRRVEDDQDDNSDSAPGHAADTHKQAFPVTHKQAFPVTAMPAS